MRFLFLALIVLILAPVALGATIIGNGSANFIIGSQARDHIEGRGGNDRIRGRGGNDLILCGKGRDHCWGDRGADYIVGGYGNDRIYAGCPDGSCNAGSGNELFGGPGHDTIGADNGKVDRIDCGTGEDTVFMDAFDDWARCERRVVDGVDA